MNCPINASPSPFTPIQALIFAIEQYEMTDEEIQQLDQILCDDPEARQFYARYMLETTALRDWAAFPNVDDAAAILPEVVNPFGQIIADDLISSVKSPPINLLSTAYHGTVGFFSQEVPFAILMATLFMAMGGLIGSVMTVEHYTQMPWQSQSSADPSFASNASADKTIETEEEVKWVGRITAMVDCKWSNDKNFRSPGGNYVSLGRKYKLDSGLMEITYYTGAKVILQGPVTYEVESANSGYMSVGKLTGKVEVEKAKGFIVRTPTALVTDLGTEFGVEVDADGRSEVHVLQGVVEASFHKVGEPATANPVRLTQGEALRYDPAGPRAELISINRASYARIRILRPDERRERWLEYSRKLRSDSTLVAYYTFEPENAGKKVLRNVSAAGSALDGRIQGALWMPGRFLGKPSLWFRGRGFDDLVELPDESRFDFTGSFSLAIWFKAGNPSDFPSWSSLIAKANTSWNLYRFENTERGEQHLSFDTRFPGDSIYDIATTRVSSQQDIFDGRWHLVVVVFQSDGKSGCKRLYMDGRLVGETKSPPVLQTNNEPVWLGNWNSSDGASDARAFCGWIDEAAIFSRALSNQEINEMFFAGDPLRAVPGGETKPGDNSVQERRK